MSPATPANWREIQKENITSLETLCRFLEIQDADYQKLTNSPFILNLPKRLALKMEKGNIDCPLFRQFVPLKEESIKEGLPDPVGDQKVRFAPKLLQKYAGRALILVTSSCAMHCRFCFRRHFPYERQISDFKQELDWIKQDETIEEVILSGGDPLSLSNERLEQLIGKLEEISHVKRLRFHTRFPIGIPERIDEGFLHLLEKTTLQVWFTIHVNHSLELDEDVLAALKKIRRLGIPVLNQSVLLKGINDTVEALKSLCQKLINNGILPYYLHQLDRLEGGLHFEVPENKGLELIAELNAELSGYGVPKYVKECSGHLSKTLISPIC